MKSTFEHQVLMEEKFDGIRIKLGYSPCLLSTLPKKWKELKGTTRTTTKFLKQWPFETTDAYPLQLYDPVARYHFCDLYFQPVHNGKFGPKLTFISDNTIYIQRTKACEQEYL
jgi:hypothetical protein